MLFKCYTYGTCNADLQGKYYLELYSSAMIIFSNWEFWDWWNLNPMYIYMMLDQCMLQRGSTVLNNLSNKMLNIHCLCVGGRKEICHTCNVQRGLCQNNSKECFLVFRLHPLTLWPRNEIKTQKRVIILLIFFQNGNSNWNSLDAPDTLLYPWDEKSTYIKSPPFFNDMVSHCFNLKFKIWSYLNGIC